MYQVDDITTGDIVSLIEEITQVADECGFELEFYPDGFESRNVVLVKYKEHDVSQIEDRIDDE